MNLPGDVKERLLAATARAAEEPPGEGAGEPPRPGDLLILPLELPLELESEDAEGGLPADAGIEWAVLAVDGPAALLVPADSRLLVGPGDLEVNPQAGADGGPGPGPLVLRCRHALTLPTATLTGAILSGRLPAATVEEARGLARRLEAGSAVIGREARRTAADPEYRAWLEEAVLPHRRAAARLPAADGGGSRATSPLPFPPRRQRSAAPAGLGWALAALFFLAAVGLGLWSAQLRSELGSARLTAYAGFEIDLTGPVRSGLQTIPGIETESEDLQAVPLILPREMIGRRIQVELLRGGQVHWTNPLPAEDVSAYLHLPASFLRPDGELLVRVWAVDGAEPEILAEGTVILE